MSFGDETFRSSTVKEGFDSYCFCLSSSLVETNEGDRSEISALLAFSLFGVASDELQDRTQIRLVAGVNAAVQVVKGAFDIVEGKHI